MLVIQRQISYDLWLLEFKWSFDIANFLEANDACCHFPFKYKGSNYNQCTRDGHHQLWCATQVDADGNYNGNWKNCDENCKGEFVINFWLKKIPIVTSGSEGLIEVKVIPPR